MKKTKFPPGLNEARVRRVLARYESQSDAEAVAEDEAAYEAAEQTMMEVPRELVPAVRELIAGREQRKRRTGGRRRAKKVGSAAHTKRQSQRVTKLLDEVVRRAGPADWRPRCLAKS